MAKNESERRNKSPSLVERLFGDLTDLSDEEIDLLYGAFSAREEPAQAVYRVAEGVAVEYRKKDVPVPEHTRAAVEATHPLSSLEGAKPALLQKLVDKLRKPVAGPVRRPCLCVPQP